MKAYILTIVLVFMLIFCNSKSKYNNKSRGTNNVDIQINFYSSSGGTAIYLINLLGDNLIIRNLEPRNNENTFYKRTLSKDGLKEVKQIIGLIKQRRNVKTEIILDSWRVELIVNGTKYYNKSGIRLEILPKNIKKLLYFLMKESTVEIDLYGFS